ncbi:aldo/keto reductase [Pseudobacteroides cellulosolvens]|uniref:Aryl-alcohol dehydrogenase (NADP(+)) n=1 Tax=Pseudobacteroides cellulosolvens ATCC 35603 = DSM 2933 TaxID=398512 RepID=A0A0L6JR20_9FIRM|nr:aldo/keto reductase [Pseudobacteroides cellulosolvens]KNY28150.1 Aryl-alcohol dehydrogenase (NADP(+)) [Pseudobacteroides cellulosolvens ATCC 35603 = DSM 2933]
MKYNKLGNTGVLVSELCLGTMTFGGQGFCETFGKVQEEEVKGILKRTIEQGINYIDTANSYSDGLSETILGNSLKSLGVNRQEVFVATKVRSRTGPGVNQVGLSRLHINYSVEDSLKRLGMTHIDLLYLHGVDFLTPLEETMRGLEDVVQSGKVRYIGISNHPAWKVVNANSIAEKMGWSKFCALQYYYSIAGRDIEREVVPMALEENLALMPWSPLAGGFLTGKYTRDDEKAGNSRRDNFDFPPVDKNKAYDIISLMDKIARKHNATIPRIAIAWLLHKKAVTSVVVGVKTIDQLDDNLEAAKIKLSEEEMTALDNISKIHIEYPEWMQHIQNQDRISNY